MDSAAELADYLDHLREEMAAATSSLWRVTAGWSREQMIDAGALVYYSIAKDLAHIAGVYEQDDWYLIDERANRFKGLLNDEYGNLAIAELVGFVSLSSQQGSEYHMARHSDARGEMWSTIPYSVLSDDEWTPAVGPWRAATSTLPAKTARYTTTRGQLTQEECNALARGFTPAALVPGLRYLDDTWVKNHAGDPRAGELYRRTQQNSPVLAGRGAGLLQDDVVRLRAAAGRTDNLTPAS
jgi:hypothetical protein